MQRAPWVRTFSTGSLVNLEIIVDALGDRAALRNLARELHEAGGFTHVFYPRSYPRATACSEALQNTLIFMREHLHKLFEHAVPLLQNQLHADCRFLPRGVRSNSAGVPCPFRARRLEIDAGRIAAIRTELAGFIEHIGDSPDIPAAKSCRIGSTITRPLVMYSHRDRRRLPPPPWRRSCERRSVPHRGR